MRSAADIRQLYTPVQPTVRSKGEHVMYSEILPDARLQPFVYCYWELKTKTPLTDEFFYRVVADGCIDIFFDANMPSENFIMGFCKKYTEFALQNEFYYIGIRFLPAMFPQMFRVNAAELSNRVEDLYAVVPRVSSFITTTFRRHFATIEIKSRLDEFFLQFVNDAHLQSDARLHNAVHIILKNAGVIEVEKDLDTGLSPRQLRRLFEYYIGDSAKTFSKVVRFQNILRAKPSTQSLQQNHLFFDIGYYDQAHFIKEFKNFYGVTPAKAFGR